MGYGLKVCKSIPPQQGMISAPERGHLESYFFGPIVLGVVFGTPENYRSEEITFQVASFNNGYHALLGRDAFTRFQAIPRYGYMKLKMPGPNGIITLTSDPDIALRRKQNHIPVP